MGWDWCWSRRIPSASPLSSNSIRESGALSTPVSQNTLLCIAPKIIGDKWGPLCLRLTNALYPVRTRCLVPASRNKLASRQSCDMPSKRPILVTGSHRSGSTWVGRIIAACPSVAYIDEPFHIKHDLGVCGARFDHWFTYVSEQNETDFYTHIKNTLDFRYNWTGKLKSIRTPKALHPLLVHYIRFLLYSHTNARPLLKDPIAIFSVDWLASKFDMDVLVLIRHPAAFAGSLKVNNWTHPFSHFLDQFLLMRDHLYPFEEEIRKWAEEILVN